MLWRADSDLGRAAHTHRVMLTFYIHVNVATSPPTWQHYDCLHLPVNMADIQVDYMLPAQGQALVEGQGFVGNQAARLDSCNQRAGLVWRVH